MNRENASTSAIDNVGEWNYSLEGTTSFLAFEFELNFWALLYNRIDKIIVVIVFLLAHHPNFFGKFATPIYLENFIAYFNVHCYGCGKCETWYTHTHTRTGCCCALCVPPSSRFLLFPFLFAFNILKNNSTSRFSIEYFVLLPCANTLDHRLHQFECHQNISVFAMHRHAPTSLATISSNLAWKWEFFLMCTHPKNASQYWTRWQTPSALYQVIRQAGAGAGESESESRTRTTKTFQFGFYSVIFVLSFWFFMQFY